jgi:hypothetical protein
MLDVRFEEDRMFVVFKMMEQNPPTSSIVSPEARKEKKSQLERYHSSVSYYVCTVPTYLLQWDTYTFMLNMGDFRFRRLNSSRQGMSRIRNLESITDW